MDITGMLQKALEYWNTFLTNALNLLMTTPQNFRGGNIWQVVLTVYSIIQGAGTALLITFWGMGILKEYGSFADLKRPDVGIKLLIRFALAQAVIIYGMDLILLIFSGVQNILLSVMRQFAYGAANLELPQAFIDADKNASWMEDILPMLLGLVFFIVICACAIIILLMVYSRVFKFFLYVALSPIPLSTFGGSATAEIGKTFLKNFCSVCLEVVVLFLCFILFDAFFESPPFLMGENSQYWMIMCSYMIETIISMLILVGLVKGADRLTKEILGL
jgi:hypothetical protein